MPLAFPLMINPAFAGLSCSGNISVNEQAFDCSMGKEFFSRRKIGNLSFLNGKVGGGFFYENSDIFKFYPVTLKKTGVILSQNLLTFHNESKLRVGFSVTNSKGTVPVHLPFQFETYPDTTMSEFGVGLLLTKRDLLLGFSVSRNCLLSYAERKTFPTGISHTFQTYLQVEAQAGHLFTDGRKGFLFPYFLLEKDEVKWSFSPTLEAGISNLSVGVGLKGYEYFRLMGGINFWHLKLGAKYDGHILSKQHASGPIEFANSEFMVSWLVKKSQKNFYNLEDVLMRMY